MAAGDVACDIYDDCDEKPVCSGRKRPWSAATKQCKEQRADELRTHCTYMTGSGGQRLGKKCYWSFHRAVVQSVTRICKLLVVETAVVVVQEASHPARACTKQWQGYPVVSQEVDPAPVGAAWELKTSCTSSSM